MKATVNENRRAQRHTEIINVDCVLDSLPEDISSEKTVLKRGESFRARTINVSETGMLINLGYLIPERTIIEITVHEGAVVESEIKLKASVVWTKRNAYRLFGRYAAGVRIVNGDKTGIRKLIENSMSSV
jgi:hypothetical protein